jgi:hypothetical protein
MVRTTFDSLLAPTLLWLSDIQLNISGICPHLDRALGDD